MAKVVIEDVGAFCQHYPGVAAIVTAQAGGTETSLIVYNWFRTVTELKEGESGQ